MGCHAAPVGCTRWTCRLVALVALLGCCIGTAAGATAQDTATASSGSDGGDSHQYSHHDQETLIFLFGTIFIGTVVLHLTTLPMLHHLPVTVVLFVLGVIFTFLVEHNCLYPFGMLVRSYQSWVAIDPHLLLFTFLPALLCGDAMTIDTHIAKRTLGQCLILAGPGVAIGSFATAGLLYGILPYGWDFWTCLTVGSILAATDPVAVVGLLKALGASPVLTMQIQGESLLNDGTAIVLFSVAYDIVAGEEYGAGRIIGVLLQSTLGASLLGAAIGFFFFFWIRLASDKLDHNSMIIQISLTLLCAYWSFIFAEGVCHISGVLSTVAAAAVLAHMMWPVVVEQRSMLETWHVIETVGNTMVFFLAGVLTGKAMLSSSWQDYLWTVVMYVLMNILRLVMLFLLRPLLNLVGQPVSIAEVLVMTWGGLRGMVGLALAILVRQDLAKGRLSTKDGDRILFLVSGIAALTLIVNATTSPAVCKILRITQAPECRKILVRNVAKRAERHVQGIVLDLQSGKASQGILVGFVKQTVDKMMMHVKHDLPRLVESAAPASSFGMTISPVSPFASEGGEGEGSAHLRRHYSTTRMAASASTFMAGWLHGGHGEGMQADSEALWKEFDDQRTELLRTGAYVEVFQYGKQLPDMRAMLDTHAVDGPQVKLVREVFLEALRASYWEQLKQGRFLVGSSEPAILLNSVNLAKDKCATGLHDWKALERECVVPEDPGLSQTAPSPRSASIRASTRSESSTRTINTVHSNQKQSWFRRQWEEWKIRRHFSSQMKAVQVIDAFIEAHKKAQMQIASYFGDNEDVDSPEETWVLIESQIEVYKAAIARSKIEKNVQVKVNTMWRIHLLAEEYRNFVIAAHESGILQAKEAETLLHPLAHSMHELQRDRKQIKQALQQERSLRKKITTRGTTCATSLTRVDAVVRIQRCYRKYSQSTKVRRAISNRRQSALQANDVQVEDMDDAYGDGISGSTATGGADVRVESVDPDGFASVLPNSVRY